MLSIIKTTSQNFGLAIQDQISIKHKLENIEGLPTLELDFLSTDGQDGSTVEPTERPNLHQKQQIAKNALEKKYKVRLFCKNFDILRVEMSVEVIIIDLRNHKVF